MTKWYIALVVTTFVAWYFFSYEGSAVFTNDTVDMGVWKEQISMYQVKIFDGNGKLLRIVQPVFDPDAKPNRKFQAHPCPDCGEKTSNKKYCVICIGKRNEKTLPSRRK